MQGSLGWRVLSCLFLGLLRRKAVVPGVSVLGLLGVLLVLPGCTGGPRSLTVVTDAQAAVSDFGEPLPIPVRLFSLRQQEAFLQADYDALWNDPIEVLAGDLVGDVARLELKPGVKEGLLIGEALPQSSAWVGVQLLTAQTEGAVRRRVVLPADRLDAVMLIINQNGIEIRANPVAQSNGG